MNDFKEKLMKINTEIKDEYGLGNMFEVSKITKVVVSSGVGSNKDEERKLLEIEKTLMKFTGQKAKINKSRKSVSAFKLRENQTVGFTVTLRDKKMYDFLRKLANAALPRVRDFKGIPNKGFDKSGNYSLGVVEHTIMPEVKHEDVSEVFGFQVNINIDSTSKEMSKSLLSKVGFVFEKE
jgi:large subunit ribosomal protein L5